MAKFGLVGKSVVKGDITGFFVVDESGKQMLLSKNKIIQLAENGVITNWEVVTDEDNEKHLFSSNISIADLPNMIKEDLVKITPTAKIIKENKFIGYRCKDDKGINHNYKMDKVWQLATLGLIDKTRAFKHDNTRILISDEGYLDKLPVIEI